MTYCVIEPSFRCAYCQATANSTIVSKLPSPFGRIVLNTSTQSINPQRRRLQQLSTFNKSIASRNPFASSSHSSLAILKKRSTQSLRITEQRVTITIASTDSSSYAVFFPNLISPASVPAYCSRPAHVFDGILRYGAACTICQNGSFNFSYALSSISGSSGDLSCSSSCLQSPAYSCAGWI